MIIHSLQSQASTEVTYLGLKESIDLALSKNLGLQIERYNPSIAADEVDVAKADFDPNFTFLTEYDQQRAPSASSELDGAVEPESEDRLYSIAIEKKIKTGAILSLDTALNRNVNNSAFTQFRPDYGSVSAVGIVQPLLKGQGSKVNLAPLVQARSNHRQSLLELRQETVFTIAETELRYWDLSYAYALKALRNSSLELAKKLFEETSEKKKGRASDRNRSPGFGSISCPAKGSHNFGASIR